jgi:hypothetical protein
MTNLGAQWLVEVIHISKRGHIDTLKLTHIFDDICYPRVRFDRGKRIFIDPAPVVSQLARDILAYELQVVYITTQKEVT